jgi:hypothetical protein
MHDTALFVGWDETHPGREEFARKHFAEWVEILTQLKAEGEIEDFENVLLAPHGGVLDGFTLVYATPETLATLPMRENLHRLQVRASLDHATFIVVPATAGVGVEREFALVHEAIEEYGALPIPIPEPALA